MKGIAAVALGAALLLQGCSGGSTVPMGRPPLPAEPNPGPAPAANTLESQLHDLVNQRRRAQRLPPLEWDTRVAEIARGHSEAMARRRRSFGHDEFDKRAAAIGALISVRSLAENVAYDGREGAELARLVVEGWISSPGHRQNIEGDFTVTGIGAARAPDGVHYFTQIFVQQE